MKSILDNRPELAKEVNKVAEVAGPQRLENHSFHEQDAGCRRACVQD